MIAPNQSDGVADAFGAGDFWLLRFSGSPGLPGELDDPPGTGAAANLGPWVDGDSLYDQDIVIWYAAHDQHDEVGSPLISPLRNGSEVIGGHHVVGPDLIPIRW